MSIDVQREINRVYQQVLRAKNMGLPATLIFEEWIENINRFDGMCAYCGILPFSTMDHLVPVFNGGGTVQDNCLPACQSCNSRKTGRLISTPGATLEEQIQQVKHVLENNIRIPKPEPARKRTPQDANSISIRFPLPLLDALHEIAKEDNRSLNGEVIAVLQRFVDDRKKKKAKG